MHLMIEVLTLYGSRSKILLALRASHSGKFCIFYSLISINIDPCLSMLEAMKMFELCRKSLSFSRVTNFNK